MTTEETTDQQKFDEEVQRKGKLVLEVLAGVGIFAALIMSTIALLQSSDQPSGGSSAMRGMSGMGAGTGVASTASTASVEIEHVTRGCHDFVVNGVSPGSPSATIHLSAGGSVSIQNNDVMPHRLVLVSGPAAALATPAMDHMGARSTATFPSPGTYALTTKAGEDYTSGIRTIGEDNTLRLTVVVGS